MRLALIPRPIIAGLIALSWASQALAAPAAEPNLYAMSLDELLGVKIGIASKQPETVRQAPSAVTVFTRDEIRAMGIDNVYDLLNYVPGFQTTRMIDVVQESQIHSRGVANLNGDILFLLNGHRLNENSQGRASRFNRHLSTANVKQVEVIRGPGSALYGSHAFLGVINIIPLTDGNDAEVHAGAFDTVGGHANLSHTFGALAASASLSYDQDRGEEYHQGDDYPQGPATTRDPAQDLNLATTLALHGTTLELSHMNHQDEDFIAFNGVAPAGTAWSETASTLVALSHDWKLSEALQLKGGLSFAQQTMSSVGWFAAAKPPTASYDRLLGPYSQNSAYEATLDGSYRIDAKSDLTGGAFYHHEGTDFLGFYTNYLTPANEAGKEDKDYLGGAEAVKDVQSLDSREQFLDNYGLYAQYRRDLSPTWHGIAGLRYDQYDVTGGTANPRLGLIWDVGDDTTLKAFWGSAFRSPSLNELYTDSPKSVGNLALKPETVETAELVCQQRFRTLELEGVFFHNHLTDTIERTTIAAAPFNGRQTWDNGAETNYDGLEARLIWDPVAALRLTLTHTHVFSELGPSTYPDFSSFIVNAHHGRWQANVNGIVRQQPSEDVLDQGAYVITNARVAYQLNKTVALIGHADNLFNVDYTTYESPFSALNPSSNSPYFTSVPNQGQRWLLGLEAKW